MLDDVDVISSVSAAASRRRHALFGTEGFKDFEDNFSTATSRASL
jgi:hypothetical protein